MFIIKEVYKIIGLKYCGTQNIFKEIYKYFFMDEFFDKIGFPYSFVREGQDRFIKKVYSSIEQKKNVMISAPTGSGKTISALAPALYYAKKNNVTVICLTSRQTQANQVIKTIRDISNKTGQKYKYMAFIGKRNMCVHPDRDLYPPSDFNEFCKKVRETGKCKFFRNARDEEHAEDIKAIIEQSSQSFMDVEGFVNLAGSCNFCPYEIAGFKAFKADVIVCDYNYLFSPGIRESFLGRIGRNLEECVIVVDEAHNLPDRIRNSYSYTLSSEIIKNSLSELKEFVKSKEYDEYVYAIKNAMEDLLFEKMDGDKEGFLIDKNEFFIKLLEKFGGKMKIEDICDKLYAAGALVRDERVISFTDRIANFLQKWEDSDEESYLRVMEKSVRENKTVLSLKIKCIDPSEISSEVLNHSYSSILMSGTLSPIEMYRDILGVGNCELLELESPFLSENQLTLVDNEITTKFTARSPQMYKTIAEKIEIALKAGEGKNALIFFPSYSFMERVVSDISLARLDRKVLKEQKFMTKEEKEKFIDAFKNNGFETRAKVLFAVTSGSFAEGLDLPEDALEMVVVVGLPLAVPDVFTQAVIRHFDKKFKRGQLYGYVYPAMSKIIQAAGRCIRTEIDRGVVVLMDSRFLFPMYALSFPKHWKMQVPQDIGDSIKNFFK